MLLASLGLGVFGVAALAADRTDPYFGQNGLATVPQPKGAASAAAGVWDLDRAPDGRLVAALGGVGEYAYFGAARFNEDGSVDRSFASEGFTPEFVFPRAATATKYVTQAQGVAVQGDGRFVVAGLVQSVFLDRISFLRHLPLLVRYQTDGSLDPSFGEGGFAAPAHSHFTREVFRGLAIGPDGRIIAVGSRDEIERDGTGFVAAYTADGQLDSTFGKKGFVSMRAQRRGFGASPALLSDVEILPSGKIVIAGYLGGRLLVARLMPSGGPDLSFGDGDGKVFPSRLKSTSLFTGEWSASLAVQPDGRIVVEGEVRTLGDRQLRIRDHPTLARLRPNGKLDRSFSRDGLVSPKAVRSLARGRDIALQADGRIVIAGWDGGPRRYLPNGTLDRSFGSLGTQAIPGVLQAALTQADGVVVGGYLGRTVGDRFETDLLLTRFLAG